MVGVGINGMGRIGRALLRWAVDSDDLDVVGVNDIVDAETIARLLQRDSTFGRWRRDIAVTDGALVIDGREIAVSGEPSPATLPWAALGVDIAVEASGRFRTRELAAGHLTAGARRVVITAPGKGVDGTFVVGVNDSTLDPDRHVVVSNASCTTNCVAPMVKVLHEAFGVEHGLMTTVHAYTNDQNLLDGPHKDSRRARSAAVNIIPTSTGAAGAVGEVIPELAGHLDGVSLRVPVVDGSLVDLTVLLAREASVTEVNAAFERAATHGPLVGILRHETGPMVSSDIIGDPASCVFDSGLTEASGRVVKVFGWYDNEWGYTCRTGDLVMRLAEGLRVADGGGRGR